MRLVGGCIRDAFLGKETKDIDVAANVKPDEIIKILKKHKIQYENFAYRYNANSSLNDQEISKEWKEFIKFHTSYKFLEEFAILKQSKSFL